MAGRLSRRVVAAGLVGCSAAALYYLSGTSSVTGPRDGQKEATTSSSFPRAGLGPGQASVSPSASATSPAATRPGNRSTNGMHDSGHVPIEDPLAAAIATHKKGMRQRVKDSINRRRAQRKFPYNKWWKWKRRRQELEQVQDFGNIQGERVDGQAGSGDNVHDVCSTLRSGGMPTTAQVAAAFPDIIGDIKLVASTLLDRGVYRDKLDENGLAPRFDDLEITRYAIHYGLLRIDRRDATDRNSDGYRMVVQDAAEGIIDSQEWFGRHEFASIQDIHKDEFSTLIRWEYTPETDERPTLHVDVGRAVAVCVNKAKQREFANIILTMMELASLNSPLTGLSRLPPGGIDRIDVVIYADGTNTMNATSAFWILRAVVRTVSHHYPGRLNTLVLHDLPTFLNWVVLGVKKLVHPDTAKKFVVT